MTAENGTGLPTTQNVSVKPWPEVDLEQVTQCPVCGSEERNVLHDGLTDRVFYCAPGEWTLYRCTNCGSGYLNPRPTPTSIGGAYAEYFTHSTNERAADGLPPLKRMRRALANGYKNWRFGTPLRPASKLGVPAAALLPWLRTQLDASCRYLPKVHAAGARLLDIGAGNGDFLALARSTGWVVTGVEPDAKAAAICRGRQMDVRQGGIEELASEQACFDYITINHVIEHVHDPRAVLSRAYALLKPGGTVYIDTPNIDAYGHERFGSNWRGLEPPRHLVLFNWKSMANLLREVGFSTLAAKPRFGLYAWLASQSKAMERRVDPYLSSHVTMADRLREYLLALKLLASYSDSEFVTVLASKGQIVKGQGRRHEQQE